MYCTKGEFFSGSSFSMLVAALAVAGLCKGIYDANIFASLFDVVGPEDRGTAAGLMNSVGWTGGFLAPVAVGLVSKYFGLSLAITSTAAVYLFVGLLASLRPTWPRFRALLPRDDRVEEREGQLS